MSKIKSVTLKQVINVTAKESNGSTKESAYVAVVTRHYDDGSMWDAIVDTYYDSEQDLRDNACEHCLESMQLEELSKEELLGSLEELFKALKGTPKEVPPNQAALDTMESLEALDDVDISNVTSIFDIPNSTKH